MILGISLIVLEIHLRHVNAIVLSESAIQKL
jgi:hypothetical protein